MKKLFAVTAVFALCLSLAACGGSGESTSGAASSDSSVASSASHSDSFASSADVSDSADVPESDASSAAEIEVSRPGEDWLVHFLTLPVETQDGSVVENALLVLKTPALWEYDNYTTFSSMDKKAAEVLHLWKAAEGDSPFADYMTEPYTDSSYYPEGFGLMSTEDAFVNDFPVRILRMKTLPDDAAEPACPLYVFCELEGYVVEIHFHFDHEPGTEQWKQTAGILSSMDLHFSRDNVSESASSASVPSADSQHSASSQTNT